MKVIILAAGWGSRLRPLTDDRPKCMVKVKGRSIIRRQLDTMFFCGIKEEDITIIAGYKSEALKQELQDTKIQFLVNEKFETTNMVYSLMCARRLMEEESDIIVSYGDIIYGAPVLRKILDAKEDMSVIVDDEWYAYWKKRCENPLDDAETLMFDEEDYLTEIGQKTTEIARVQSQYIGLMRFRGDGLKDLLALCTEAERRSKKGEPLWRTTRNYAKMYMTDLLQGLIEEGRKLRAIHICRGWFEIDDNKDLKIAEREI